MSDIFFKCGACGNHLVVDEGRRGISIKCPDCSAPITIPTALAVQQCHNCGERLMIAPDTKGVLVHCSSCHEPVRAAGLCSDPDVAEHSVAIVCPQCHASVNVSEEISNRPTPCPRCGEQVYFQDAIALKKGQTTAGPPKAKEHDGLRFRRKSR
jgi:DNA-directed RNA polymerase subunit RPC12/RpoP